MKQLNEVLSDIKELQDRHKELNLGETTKASKKDGKLVAIYRKAATYLELEPTEESVLSQQKLLKKRIKAINDGYSAWLENTPETKEIISAGKNPKDKYHALMETKKWKAELAFCNYLLS